MNNIKHIVLMTLLSLSLSISGQSYFFSIGDSKTLIEPPVTETTVDSVDTVMVELPVEVKNVKTVSMPLDNLHCTSPFGIRRDPIKGTRRMHSGLDLRARFEDVRAMLPGTVIKTGYSKTAGYFVTMSHGICVCSYLHLSHIGVREGSHVSAGDIVGVTGSSGRSTGPHLHISCRWNDNKGKYFNPVLLLSFVASKIREKD